MTYFEMLSEVKRLCSLSSNYEVYSYLTSPLSSRNIYDSYESCHCIVGSYDSSFDSLVSTFDSVFCSYVSLDIISSLNFVVDYCYMSPDEYNAYVDVSGDSPFDLLYSGDSVLVVTVGYSVD